MENEKEIKRMVERKIIHWNLYPKCNIARRQMVFLEEQNCLSKKEAERLSNMSCIGCKICKQLY